MLFVNPIINAVAALLLIMAGIIVVIFLIIQTNKLLLKLVVGLVANALLGFVALGIVGYIFGIDIALTLPVIASVIVFGLPAVGTMIIIQLTAGIALAVALL